MRGLILEGIPGSGKTALLRALLLRVVEQHRGPLWVATEHITERVLEPLAQASPLDARTHAASHLNHLFNLWEWEKAAPAGPDVGALFVLERFHLSLESHISGIGPGEFQAWDERLAELGGHLLFLTLPETEILEKSVRETLARRSIHWRAYLESLAMTEEAIAEHFQAEQEKMRRLFCASHIRKTELSRTALPLEQMVTVACDILGLKTDTSP